MTVNKLIAFFAPIRDRAYYALLARVIFLFTTFGWLWRSAFNKFDGFLKLDIGAYIQIFPKHFEAIGYDPSALSFFHKIIAFAGSVGEMILPVMLVLGLFTRGAAIGLIVFISVLSYVDVTGHGVKFINDIQFSRVYMIFAFFIIAVQGGGRISLDYILFRKLRK